MTPTGGNLEIDMATRIASNPKYQELKAKRSSFGWWLTLAMMVVYFAFILLVAYDKPLLAQLVAPGLSLGILLGALVILLSWLALRRRENASSSLSPSKKGKSLTRDGCGPGIARPPH